MADVKVVTGRPAAAALVVAGRLGLAVVPCLIRCFGEEFYGERVDLLERPRTLSETMHRLATRVKGLGAREHLWALRSPAREVASRLGNLLASVLPRCELGIAQVGVGTASHAWPRAAGVTGVVGGSR